MMRFLIPFGLALGLMVVTSIMGIGIGKLIHSNTEEQHNTLETVKKTISECEKDLIRSKNCITVISAKVKEDG
jgi:hypothetical protein